MCGWGQPRSRVFQAALCYNNPYTNVEVLIMTDSSATDKPGAGEPQISEYAALLNGAHFINVTKADGVCVLEPLLVTQQPRTPGNVAVIAEIARENTRRMQGIMERAGEQCTIFFPAGNYFFDGAAPGWTASIETTEERQTFRGDNMNSSLILQISTQVRATLAVKHTRGAVLDLHIGSADFDDEGYWFDAWTREPHQTAILIDGSDVYFGNTDITVRQVSLNAAHTHLHHHNDDPSLPDSYNTYLQGVRNLPGNPVPFAFTRRFRPFVNGIEITRNNLHVTCEHIIGQELINTIHMSSPHFDYSGAYAFADIRVYPFGGITDPAQAIGFGGRTRRGAVWTTFLRVDASPAEQMTIRDCSFSGHQFLAVMAEKMWVGLLTVEGNTVEAYGGGELPDQSPLYFRVPTAECNVSRNIRILGNNLQGIVTRRVMGHDDGAAMIMIDGGCAGMQIADNIFTHTLFNPPFELQEGSAIYVRGSDPWHHADLVIANNIFAQGWSSAIVIGSNHGDEERESSTSVLEPETTEGVVIIGNAINADGKVPASVIYLHAVQNCCVANNTIRISDTSKTAIGLRDADHVTVTGNTATLMQPGDAFLTTAALCRQLLLADNNHNGKINLRGTVSESAGGRPPLGGIIAWREAGAGVLPIGWARCDGQSERDWKSGAHANSPLTGALPRLNPSTFAGETDGSICWIIRVM